VASLPLSDPLLRSSLLAAMLPAAEPALPPIVQSPLGRYPKFNRHRRNRFVLLGAGVLAALLCVSALSFFLLSSEQRPSPRSVTPVRSTMTKVATAPVQPTRDSPTTARRPTR
jgi:hypothetical protein